jgi:N-acetylmuramoyl-L-alanine amidase
MLSRFKISFLLLLSATQLFADEIKLLEFTAKSGDASYVIFKKYELNISKCNLDYFRQINKLPENLNLIIDKTYKLPVIVYQYNSTNIRTTIGNNDMSLAKKIQAYNEEMLKKGIRDKDYRDDKILWVPYDYLFCGDESVTDTKQTIVYPLFGEKYKNVQIKDNKLKGFVYYLEAGHGGPDPGAMGNYNGHTLCEDEYAYDIALRMARILLEHNATVYMITQDKNDGIRDKPILDPDKDEVYYGNKPLPLNQIARLDLACSIINELYNEHKDKGAKKQRAVNLHLDSRGTSQRVDMFFYYNPKSNTGKKLANTIKNTVEEKYNHHQKNRGYFGTVKPRNLHMLRKVIPTSVFIELGNIRNSADQKRFILKENRQAVANWLVEGLMNETLN